MEILGVTYSNRIDKLCHRLRKLAKADVVFDHSIDYSEKYWTAVGQYHIGRMPPSISLVANASEETVAHEVLHGILEHTGYPCWIGDLRKYWEFATATAKVACHCAVHVVIDARMQALGYDIRAIKEGSAELHLGDIPKCREWTQEASGEHWYSLLIAAAIARYRVSPAIDKDLLGRFIAEAGRCFPTYSDLVERFSSIAAKMRASDRKGVRATIWMRLRERMAIMLT